jgi:hypothetical protein
MKTLKIMILTVVVSAVAFAEDVPLAVPEVGVDGPAVVSVVGIVTGGLLILRARRNRK